MTELETLRAENAALRAALAEHTGNPPAMTVTWRCSNECHIWHHHASARPDDDQRCICGAMTYAQAQEAA